MQASVGSTIDFNDDARVCGDLYNVYVHVAHAVYSRYVSLRDYKGLRSFHASGNVSSIVADGRFSQVKDEYLLYIKHMYSIVNAMAHINTNVNDSKARVSGLLGNSDHPLAMDQAAIAEVITRRKKVCDAHSAFHASLSDTSARATVSRTWVAYVFDCPFTETTLPSGSFGQHWHYVRASHGLSPESRLFNKQADEDSKLAHENFHIGHDVEFGSGSGVVYVYVLPMQPEGRAVPPKKRAKSRDVPMFPSPKKITVTL